MFSTKLTVVKLLEGLKVLDLTPLLPGPFASMVLANLGAEVLRIENPIKPDLALQFPPIKNGKSVTDEILNGKKQRMSLNLKEKVDREKVFQLIEDYDIIIEQFRPGVMKRLGLDYETINKINPKIIYCSISGYGQKSAKAGHDINYLARSGVAYLLGKRPVVPGFQVADIVGGGYSAIIGILAAVIRRQVDGNGQYIDISMTHSVSMLNLLKSAYSFAGMEEPVMRSELLDGGSIYDFYEAADGRYLSVGSIEFKFFQELCKGLGIDYNISDYMLDTNLKQEISKIIKSKDSETWKGIFEELDACVEIVQSPTEYFRELDRDPYQPIRFI